MNILSGINRIVTKVGEELTKHELKPYSHMLKEIKNLNIGAMDNEQIKAQSLKLINEARNGASLDDLLVEAFALAAEASWKVLGFRPFDIQVMAGIALHYGNLVELQTGEGKTLDLTQRIEEGIIKTFKTVDVTKEGIDFEKEDLKSPSATWTYIVHDNYFPNKIC